MKKFYFYCIVILIWCAVVNSIVGCKTARTQAVVPTEAKTVHMQLVLKRSSSHQFFRPGYKYNDKFWYTERNGKSYQVPATWEIYSFKYTNR